MKKIIMIRKLKKLLLLLILVSCSTSPTIENNVIKNEKFKISKVIKVVVFEDKRQGENKQNIFRYILPFFKYGANEKYFPEKDFRTIISPLNYTIAHYLKEDIQNVYILDNIIISDEDFYKADYNIKGEIDTFFCSTKVYSYWLGPLGVITWYTGVPIVTKECKISISLKIENNKGKQFFSKVYTEEDKEEFTLYSGPKSEIGEFQTKLLKRLFGKFLFDIKALII